MCFEQFAFVTSDILNVTYFLFTLFLIRVLSFFLRSVLDYILWLMNTVN